MSKDDEELFGQEHVEAYRATDGERGFHWRNGTEILLLTTTGRKSGQERTTPLIHTTDDDSWVIVASKGGAPEDPAWYTNIQAADGDATIQVKADTIPVHAHDAEGEERSRLWTKMAEAWPAYDDYAEKTDREIPVVVLERR